VSLPFIVTSGPSAPLHLEYELRRDQLEQLTADLVTRTLQICEVALAQAGLRPDEIDEVILVGGQTRMPSVQRAGAAYFVREPCQGVHPDEVVALGAAIAAESLSGGGQLALHDVTAHSLGIMTAGGLFDPLIRANTPVPVRTVSVFGTSRDNQRTVKIVVLQGESSRADENEVLGRFALDGLREAPAGAVEIEVAFEIDEDGIFSVSAKDLDTGEERTIDVLASSGLSEEEIHRMMEDSAEHLALRRAEEAAESNRQACELLLETLRRTLPEAERRLAWSPTGANAVRKAGKAMETVAAGLSDADAKTLEKHRALLERVRAMVEKVLAHGKE
jgi:molecular chaperone DnaK